MSPPLASAGLGLHHNAVNPLPDNAAARLRARPGLL